MKTETKKLKEAISIPKTFEEEEEQYFDPNHI